MAVYAPVSYILPSRLAKYEALYDTDVRSGGGKLRQRDREQSLQALIRTIWLAVWHVLSIPTKILPSISSVSR